MMNASTCLRHWSGQRAVLSRYETTKTTFISASFEIHSQGCIAPIGMSHMRHLLLALITIHSFFTDIFLAKYDGWISA
jgi:hypothetical protein